MLVVGDSTLRGNYIKNSADRSDGRWRPQVSTLQVGVSVRSQRHVDTWRSALRDGTSHHQRMRTEVVLTLVRRKPEQSRL